MKTRNGFVSNSSSSSFVIRGFETNRKALTVELGIDPEADDTDLSDALSRKQPKKSKSYGIGALQIESTRCFFDGEETGTVILGETLVDLDDGCVAQLPEPDDETLRSRLSGILGREVTEKFHTFVQYIGNDNY